MLGNLGTVGSHCTVVVWWCYRIAAVGRVQQSTFPFSSELSRHSRGHSQFTPSQISSYTHSHMQTCMPRAARSWKPNEKTAHQIPEQPTSGFYPPSRRQVSASRISHALPPQLCQCPSIFLEWHWQDTEWDPRRVPGYVRTVICTEYMPALHSIGVRTRNTLDAFRIRSSPPAHWHLAPDQQPDRAVYVTKPYGTLSPPLRLAETAHGCLLTVRTDYNTGDGSFPSYQGPGRYTGRHWATYHTVCLLHGLAQPQNPPHRVLVHRSHPCCCSAHRPFSAKPK